MASFMQESVVKYACSCGILNPLYKLFFCRHCLKLRCGFCVCHEVDSHFCSNCLENIPSTEARCKKNCCANCLECPCCQHTLSARAAIVTIQRKTEEPAKEGGENENVKSITKKMYYLTCLACRWTSRDVGLPDQPVATGTWPDQECGYQERFNSLLEYYQAVVLQDKREKQEYMRRKTSKVHKFPSLTDRTGITASLVRRQMGWSDKNTQNAKPVKIEEQIEASDNVGELPDNIFTQKINLQNVTTIKQRHGQPSDQPVTVNKLYPQRRFLWIKRSLRCRQCEHNVIKPEYHPTSVKYRIQLFANYHVPEVLFVHCEQTLKPGFECGVILKLTNPTMHEMNISILQLPNLEEEMEMIEEFKRTVSLKDTANNSLVTSSSVSDTLKSLASTPVTATLATSSLSRQVSLTEDPRLVSQQVTAQLEMPPSSFILSQRDDSTEFDEDIQVPREDPKFITWRKSNKLCLRLLCTVDENSKIGDDVTIGFIIKYSYVNTVTNTPNKKEPISHELYARVYVNIGKITDMN